MNVLRWKREAKVEALQRTARNQLAALFGPLPTDLITSINAIDDVAKLNDVLLQVVRIQSLGELKL